jgi:hypothetical protein
MELLQQLIEFTCNGSNYGQETKDEKVEEVKICHKFDADIEALGLFFSLEPGSEIEIQLQGLLLICPRNRRRNDAYQGLIGELGRRGVKLSIKNRKNK